MIVERRQTHRLGIALGAVTLLGLAAALLSSRRVNTWPSLENRSVSSVFSDTADTHLGKAIMPRIDAHAEQCGVYGLADAREAFAARMHLANAGELKLVFIQASPSGALAAGEGGVAAMRVSSLPPHPLLVFLMVWKSSGDKIVRADPLTIPGI